MCDDWPLKLGPHLTGAEARIIRAFICSYHRCFAFSLQDLEGYLGNPFTFSWKTTILFLETLQIQCFRANWRSISLSRAFGNKANRTL